LSIFTRFSVNLFQDKTTERARALKNQRAKPLLAVWLFDFLRAHQPRADELIYSQIVQLLDAVELSVNSKARVPYDNEIQFNQLHLH
jgi:hypothetical protein